MKNRVILALFALTFSLASYSLAEEGKISKEQALEIAGLVEEVRAFQMNCFRRDCVEFKVEDSSAMDAKNVVHEAWLVKVVSNGLCPSAQDKSPIVQVYISKNRGDLLNKIPNSKYLNDHKYCVKDEDCLIENGYDIPVMGCINSVYQACSVNGAQVSESCMCVKHQCVVGSKKDKDKKKNKYKVFTLFN